MSDVMPYPSTHFSAMTRGEVGRYFSAWMGHIRRIVAEFQPQVIHSHHVWVMSSLVKSIATTIPVVTHCHGTGLRQMELCPALAEEVRAGCSRNEAFVVLHREHSTILQAQLGVDASRISIVGNGFRDDIFYEPERLVVGPTITYAGKLSRAKGLPWLIKAVEELASRNSGIVLHVAGSGSGPEADAIRRQIDLSERVVFHGQIDQRKLADLFRKSTVFVLPSFYEGLPLVLVEAAACGCRLVATRLPGVVHELEPQLGELLELVDLPRLERMDTPVAEDLPAFVDNLAAAIHRSLSKPPPEETSGHVHSMTWQAVFERIEHVWLRYMQTAGSSPGV
jgi:glycosyltransferase involved in cell wall biosynthesis